MSNLQSRLNEIAQNFADAILDAVRGTSLQDLYAANGGQLTGDGRRAPKTAAAPTTTAAKPARRSGRLPRRSLEDIAKTLDQVVGVVKKSADGLRAEQIRNELGLQAKEMPRILKEGLSTKKLRSKGQKRATTYFAK